MANLGGRNGGPDQSILILVRVAGTHINEFAQQHPAQFPLAGRAGISHRIRVSIGANANVTHEAIEQSG